jgi:hypothetical protein
MICIIQMVVITIVFYAGGQLVSTYVVDDGVKGSLKTLSSAGSTAVLLILYVWSILKTVSNFYHKND